MKISQYANITAPFSKYETNDQLVFIIDIDIHFSDYQPSEFNIKEDPFMVVCGRAFQILNQDNRPTAQMAPSLSVGDVLEIHGEDDSALWYSCDPWAWSRIEPPPQDKIIRDRTWKELYKTGDPYKDPGFAASHIVKSLK